MLDKNETQTEDQNQEFSPIPLDSVKLANLPRPHGFLIWRGKQTAIASLEPLLADEPLYLTTEDEVFGTVILSKPAQVNLKEFERPEWADKHRIRPEERRLMWPEAKAIFIQSVKEFQGFSRRKWIIDGQIMDYQPSQREKALIDLGQRLPKQIILKDEAVCLTGNDHFTAIKDAQDNEELSKILASVYERPVKYSNGKHNFSLPLYSLALVRTPNPKMRVENLLKTILSAQKAHTGVMVAFMLDPEAAGMLAISPAVLPSGSSPLPPKELHLTLSYLGDSSELQDSNPAKSDRDLIQKVISVFASEQKPLVGKIGGIGLFSNVESDGTQALYASFDSGQLPSFREELVERLTGAGIESPSNHGFTPHITLAYLPQGAGVPNIQLPGIELAFTEICLAWGGDQTRFPLLAHGNPMEKKSINSKETGMEVNDNKQHSVEEQLEELRGRFRSQFGDDFNDPWVVDILDNGFVVAMWDGVRYLVSYQDTEAGIIFVSQPDWIEATVSYMPKEADEGQAKDQKQEPESEDIKQFDESPWDGAASNWNTPEAYCKDCLIDVNPPGEKTKALCFLPYRKPGASNPNKAAIQAIGGGRGITRLKKPQDVPQEKWDSAVKAAANKVIGWWPEAFDKPAPDAIYQAAGKEPPEDSASYSPEKKEGRRLRTMMIDKLRGAVNALTEFVGWAEYADLQAEEDQPMAMMMTDFFKGKAGFTIKEVNGEPWHFTWSTNAYLDRDQEIFALKALETYVQENAQKKHKGYFNFWHIEGTDFAEKKFQAVVGKFLVEAGPYLKDQKGQAALKFFKQFPDGHLDIAPEGWGCSPEYRYLPEERPTGVYKWLWITRTSTLPKAAAANIFTESKQEFVMDIEQRKAAEALFGKDFVNNLVKEGEERTKKLDGAGVPSKSKKATEKDGQGAGSDTKQKLGAFIRSKREGMDMTVAQLAEATDLETSVISAIESGDQEPSMAQVRALASALDADADEMAGMMEEMEEGSNPAKSDEAGATDGQGTDAGKDKKEPKAEAEGEGGKGQPEQQALPDMKEFTELMMASMLEVLRPAIEGPINQLSKEVGELTDRIVKVERNNELKQKTDMSRFFQFQVKRATEAEETALNENDELKGKRPKETTPSKDGSVAGAFFPARK